MCIYIYIYVFMFLCVHLSVHMYVSAHVCVYMCVYWFSSPAYSFILVPSMWGLTSLAFVLPPNDDGPDLNGSDHEVELLPAAKKKLQPLPDERRPSQI